MSRAPLILLVLALAAGAGWYALRVPTKQLAEAEQRAGDATVGQGSAEYQLDARDIYTRGRDRERVILQTTKEVRRDILSAQGADTPLPDDVRLSVNRGLRKLNAGPDHP